MFLAARKSYSTRTQLLLLLRSNTNDFDTSLFPKVETTPHVDLDLRAYLDVTLRLMTSLVSRTNCIPILFSQLFSGSCYLTMFVSFR